MKEDILASVEDFIPKARIPSGCNSSFITLIPKKNSLVVLNDYWPISLISIQYKIFANILVLRLSKVINLVVSGEQSVFIKRRQILDDPLMVNELIDWYKKIKKKLMLLKIDFEKAYDYVS